MGLRMVEAFAAATHPADGVGGVSDDECIIGDIARNDGAGADEAVFTERYAADNRGVGADRGTFANEGFGEFMFAGNMAAGIGDVGKNHARAAENVVFECHAVENRDVVLDFDAVSDCDVVADVDPLTEHAVGANPGGFADVDEVPDACVGADGSAGVDDAGRVYVGGHGDALLEFERERDAAIFLDGTIRGDNNFQGFESFAAVGLGCAAVA